jgi:PPIC-type PPIASE domain
MRFSRQNQMTISGRVIVGLFALRQLAGMAANEAKAQAGDVSHAMDLGIIVTPTMADAEMVVKQLNAGTDFSVLAKERSIDPSASDCGYMGKLSPNQLRGELRDALQGHGVGQLTGVVQLPSGFAIVKVLPAAPAVADLNPKRISSLLSTGVIRLGAPVAGLGEADAAFQDFPKPDGWSHDLHKVCEIRKESLAHAKDAIRRVLDSPDPTIQGEDAILEQIQGHSALAQLYAYSAYSGEMDKIDRGMEGC